MAQNQFSPPQHIYDIPKRPKITVQVSPHYNPNEHHKFATSRGLESSKELFPIATKRDLHQKERHNSSFDWIFRDLAENPGAIAPLEASKSVSFCTSPATQVFRSVHMQTYVDRQKMKMFRSLDATPKRQFVSVPRSRLINWLHGEKVDINVPRAQYKRIEPQQLMVPTQQNPESNYQIMVPAQSNKLSTRHSLEPSPKPRVPSHQNFPQTLELLEPSHHNRMPGRKLLPSAQSKNSPPKTKQNKTYLIPMPQILNSPEKKKTKLKTKSPICRKQSLDAGPTVIPELQYERTGSSLCPWTPAESKRKKFIMSSLNI